MWAKLRREIEPRWVSEYVSTRYANFPHGLRVPLGPIPKQLEEMYGPAKARRVYRPSRPEVDAIVYLPERLILIEAKIFRVMDGLAKLPVYKSLVPQTPELELYKDESIAMQLLVVKPAPWVEEAARAHDIELVAYNPDWVVQIWEERDKYWTREHIEAREERKRILQKLGYR
jgi:hypothetical protein